MTKLTETQKVLMERDGMTEEEARVETRAVSNEIHEALSIGGSYDDIEDILLYDLGLEMDYIFDLLI